MLYQILRALLGPHGRWLLDFIVEYQLIIFSIIFVTFLIQELNSDPESRTGWFMNFSDKFNKMDAANKEN